MALLPFHLSFIQFLADHRTPLLTHLMSAATFFGSANAYILIILLLYILWDKRLAIRLSVLILLTMSLNEILKTLIRNPRPFVLQGTYLQKWAVSPARAHALAAEYSTPSGHAMGAGSFYVYLAIFLRRKGVWLIAILLILLIGFSRPYLGVHYGEDVLIGWVVGLAMALLLARYTAAVTAVWNGCRYPVQIAIAVLASTAFCVIGAGFDNWQITTQLEGTAAYAGFLTGSVIACPLERRYVCFIPHSGNYLAKAARLALTLGLIGGMIAVLRPSFAYLAPPP